MSKKTKRYGPETIFTVTLTGEAGDVGMKGVIVAQRGPRATVCGFRYFDVRDVGPAVLMAAEALAKAETRPNVPDIPDSAQPVPPAPDKAAESANEMMEDAEPTAVEVEADEVPVPSDKPDTAQAEAYDELDPTDDEAAELTLALLDALPVASSADPTHQIRLL